MLAGQRYYYSTKSLLIFELVTFLRCCSHICNRLQWQSSRQYEISPLILVFFFPFLFNFSNHSYCYRRRAASWSCNPSVCLAHACQIQARNGKTTKSKVSSSVLHNTAAQKGWITDPTADQLPTARTKGTGKLFGSGNLQVMRFHSICFWQAR